MAKNDLHDLMDDFKSAAGEGMSSFARQVEIQSNEALQGARLEGPQVVKVAGRSVITQKLGSPDTMFDASDSTAVQVQAADQLATAGQSLMLTGKAPAPKVQKPQKKESHKKTAVVTGQDVIETLLRMSS